jgi:hypothetical protein
MIATPSIDLVLRENRVVYQDASRGGILPIDCRFTAEPSSSIERFRRPPDHLSTLR